MKNNFSSIDNISYSLFKIENEQLFIEVSDFGATLVTFKRKDSDVNVVLRNKDANDYLLNIGEAKGATVGRNANRIENGRFSIDGIEYQCFINNGPNSLHGGKYGFMVKKFDVVSHHRDSIVFHYHSPDMEESFPGNLDLYVEYKVVAAKLYYNISYSSDKKTICNITNHAYFNLGDETVLNHHMKIHSDYFAQVDSNGLTLDSLRHVANTAFDYREFTCIQDLFDFKDDDLKTAIGYDHNYVFEDAKDGIRAELKYNNLHLKVSSDLPGVHVYSGNYLRKPQEGICFECQYFPNAINYQNYKQPIVEAGVEYKHYICFELLKG